MSIGVTFGMSVIGIPGNHFFQIAQYIGLHCRIAILVYRNCGSCMRHEYLDLAVGNAAFIYSVLHFRCNVNKLATLVRADFDTNKLTHLFQPTLRQTPAVRIPKGHQVSLPIRRILLGYRIFPPLPRGHRPWLCRRALPL